MFSRCITYFRRIIAIAKTTATELYGQPTVLLLTFGGVIATSLVPFLQMHSFGEAGRLARDSGLAYQLVIGLILAVVSAASSIHDEVSGGTAAAALAKPVSRNDFIFGKWIGVMLVTFRFWICTLATTLLAERIAERIENDKYVTDSAVQFALFTIPPLVLLTAGLLHNRKRIRFCKTALSLITFLLIIVMAIAFFFDRKFAFRPSVSNIDIRIAPVSLLVLFALGVYSAIASALATRLRAGPSMIICLALLLIGLSSDTFLSPSSPMPVRAIAALLPNLQSFWACDVLTSGGTLPLFYLLNALVYSAALTAIALGAAMFAFRTKDLP